jgi:hypothetical protein
MSRKKLTLSVDEQVIEQARRYSRRHNTSISQLVSNYLAQLDANRGDVAVSPTVRRLTGILPTDTSVEDYQRYLVEKHSR